MADDEEPIVRLLQPWLEEEGYVVQCADGFDFDEAQKTLHEIAEKLEISL